MDIELIAYVEDCVVVTDFHKPNDIIIQRCPLPASCLSPRKRDSDDLNQCTVNVWEALGPKMVEAETSNLFYESRREVIDVLTPFIEEFCKSLVLGVANQIQPSILFEAALI